MEQSANSNIIQLYAIKWKHKLKGTTDKSNRLYSRDEVELECNKLNAQYRDIEHTVALA